MCVCVGLMYFSWSKHLQMSTERQKHGLTRNMHDSTIKTLIYTDEKGLLRVISQLIQLGNKLVLKIRSKSLSFGLIELLLLILCNECSISLWLPYCITELVINLQYLQYSMKSLSPKRSKQDRSPIDRVRAKLKGRLN